MNLNFTQEDEAFRAQVAAWMQENLTGKFAKTKFRGTPGDENAFHTERREWETVLGQAGWIGIGWPTEAGGKNLSLSRQVIFNEEYARAGGPGRVGHIGENLAAPTLIACGTQDQQDRLLPGIKSGEELWCQCYSEPNAGSDLSNITTRARLENDEWVIEGQKIWTSLAQFADWGFVLARAVEGSKGRDGLVYLLVPMRQDGITIKPINQMTGDSEFNEVFFDKARTPANNLVGDVGEGWRVSNATLAFERGASTLGQQMQFRNELDLVIETAKQNGASKDPAIRARIARAHAGLKVMRMNALRMLSNTNGGLSREALMTKIYWATWHRDLGELAMDVVGEDAERIEGEEMSRLQKLFLFSRADTIYAGTNQIQRNIIAERALGLPREARGET